MSEGIWSVEDNGTEVHLESEASVGRSEDGVIVVTNLEDEEVGAHFNTVTAAKSWVESKFSAKGHVNNWLER